MKLILIVGFGSFVGGISRYLISHYFQQKTETAFSIHTLIINILGCLLIGIIYGMTDRINISNEQKLFLTTGLMGGFTTFSTFSYEGITLLRDGQHTLAISYILGSVILGLLATYAGISLIKSL